MFTKFEQCALGAQECRNKVHTGWLHQRARKNRWCGDNVGTVLGRSRVAGRVGAPWHV